ncbi:MAG: hypothetical protein JWO40_149 [Candidatus Doudnabacteria bacterium]|nr:hypothetical protein [Candidatus Doudnabacteria bacterium]
MQKINKTLNSTIKKYKIDEKVKQYQLLSIWEKVISEFMPNAAQKTMALAFEKGVLKIASLTRELAYEINLYQKRLIEALNACLGRQLVYRIVCEI